MKTTLYFLLFIFFLSFVQCARKGSVGGGPKDEAPPKMLKVNPLNETTGFNSEEIRVYFDEFVRLKDVNKNIIISPPLKETPVYEPLGTPRRFVSVKIQGELASNTTYAIHFGESIEDNNEGNKFSKLTYVFSTGTYIDSLEISGLIKESLKRTVEKKGFIGVLYKKDSTYDDSLIYTMRPHYLNFADTLGAFHLSNLKEGRYQMLAFEDKNQDFKYQTGEEKLGFVSNVIQIPSDDSIHVMNLFTEIPPKKILPPSQPDSGRVHFLFHGQNKHYKIERNYPMRSDSIKELIIPSVTNDTIDYWHNFSVGDSLSFHVWDRDSLVDTLAIHIFKLESNTWDLKPANASPVPKTKYRIRSNHPIISIDHSKIQILDKDSTTFAFTSKIKKRKNEVILDFPIKANNKYQLQLLPGAIRDFFDQTNDTLNFSFKTQGEEDFGIIRLSLLNPLPNPFFIDLVNEKEEIIQSQYTQANHTVFDYQFLKPGKYTFRIREDANQNGQWDTGNLKKRIQPEPVYHFPTIIEVRAFWELNETWQIKINNLKEKHS